MDAHDVRHVSMDFPVPARFGQGSADHADGLGLGRLSLLLVLLAIMPAMLTWQATYRSPVYSAAGKRSSVDRPRAVRLPQPSPAPQVAPPQLYVLDADMARARNAAIPFTARPNPAASPYRFSGTSADMARATDCLASAQIYEAGDHAIGEQAVAQVVLNRVRHPAFPKTICGVIFQGQDRRTGCQFTFTCDGSLARTPSQAAWERARAIASAAIGGAVFDPVGLATHYHTDWVAPYWSDSLDKTAKVGTHIFLRWSGWWGTPPAFAGTARGMEPVIGRIARLSLAHRDGTATAAVVTVTRQAQASAPTGDTDIMPAPNKSWTPSPTMKLPGGVRRNEHVETGEGADRQERRLIALGALPR